MPTMETTGLVMRQRMTEAGEYEIIIWAHECDIMAKCNRPMQIGRHMHIKMLLAGWDHWNGRSTLCGKIIEFWPTRI